MTCFDVVELDFSFKANFSAALVQRESNIWPTSSTRLALGSPSEFASAASAVTDDLGSCSTATTSLCIALCSSSEPVSAASAISGSSVSCSTVAASLYTVVSNILLCLSGLSTNSTASLRL